MKHRFETLTKTLRDRQIDLCEEWRSVNASPMLSDSPWEKEVRNFHGGGLLSSQAWEQLEHWWRNHRDSIVA
jgi:hypothetical protein